MEGWRKMGNPAERARLYYAQGADELLYMDVVASLYERNNLSDIVREVAQEAFVPITVGGGIGDLKSAKQLLDVGADKVAVNTAATKNPEIIREISDTYGSQAMVLSIEAKSQPQGGWEAMTDNGRNHTGRDVVKWAVEAAELGAGEILITSIDRDGTMKGMDINLIKAVASEVDIPVIASGGVASSAHVSQAVEAGATAVSLAKALHTDHLSFAGLRDELSQTGMPVRNQYTGDAA
ncbi:imidazole glycerol phosphate synthase subunit HisF [Hoeflea sp.]|uniref:imidazole glycerol phosphate synthase subunit HisF n=1 Tax=Hoeflea sp. TaxID=1940281 RepID=UPI003BB15A68